MRSASRRWRSGAPGPAGAGAARPGTGSPGPAGAGAARPGAGSPAGTIARFTAPLGDHDDLPAHPAPLGDHDDLPAHPAPLGDHDDLPAQPYRWAVTTTAAVPPRAYRPVTRTAERAYAQAKGPDGPRMDHSAGRTAARRRDRGEHRSFGPLTGKQRAAATAAGSPQGEGGSGNAGGRPAGEVGAVNGGWASATNGGRRAPPARGPVSPGLRIDRAGTRTSDPVPRAAIPEAQRAPISGS
jgi:hypothetical protein